MKGLSDTTSSPQVVHKSSEQITKKGILALTSLAIISAFFVLALVVPGFVYGSKPSLNAQNLAQWQLQHLDADLAKCAELHKEPVEYEFPIPSTRVNPRWNPYTGQAQSVLLRNATLFDGATFLDGRVDILFSNGTIKAVTPTSSDKSSADTLVLNMDGKFVTPGLVDMHSHHMVELWPNLAAVDDGNEMHPDFGPLTPFVRSLDSMKPYDLATMVIASGGVTSSLLLPGSSNIIGGEGFLVKNSMKSGKNGENVVADMLLEKGVPQSERRRYLKMAAGENPRGEYGHTRMGNAWILRRHLERASKVIKEQDGWCLAAKVARESGSVKVAAFVEKMGSLPQSLELESTIALLRGQVGANIHCYEVQDFEDMLRHSHEFDFNIQAFHHALEGWKVPEMLKDQGHNITVATFSTFALYKNEAYRSNLAAGKILAEHGVPIAYKSDHSIQELSAKHLIFQAATGHSFGLPEDLALQAVTSVPARSLKIDHRVGFVRPGYDADIVVWNSHPLSVGATAMQVFIDGIATLDEKTAHKAVPHTKLDNMHQSQNRTRKILTAHEKKDTCNLAMSEESKVTIRGIQKSFLDPPSTSHSTAGNLTIVLHDSKVICFGTESTCALAGQNSTTITLQNGHVLPGITAYTNNLGLTEIVMESITTDGELDPSLEPSNVNSIVFARDSIHLEGKAFERAKIGGVTKAITPPFQGLEGGGFLGGVSVAFKIGGEVTILDGGICKDEVALHFAIGQSVKGSKSTPTISTAIAKLRKILDVETMKDTDNIYGQAAQGLIPIVISVHEKYAIMQIIKLKLDRPSLNLVILGGAEAPLVATQLANASIPLIFTSARGAPDTWEKRNSLAGPPLTVSPVSVLVKAGVKFGLAIPGFADPELFNLIIEASWAAKYAGLSDYDAVSLVSRNVEEILGLEVSQEKSDFVVWEGSPLEFGASVAFSIDGETGRVVECWPEAE